MLIPQNELKNRLHYNPNTGDFTWINISKYHKEKNLRIAGYVHNSRRGTYRVIQINSKQYFAHRLAFLYISGSMPTMVDHKNGNSLDNRWSNLKGCTFTENSQNHTKTINKSGLPAGIRRNTSGRYLARIRIDKIPLTIGTFDTVEEASAEYELAKRRYHYCPARKYL